MTAAASPAPAGLGREGERGRRGATAVPLWRSWGLPNLLYLAGSVCFALGTILNGCRP